MNNINMKVNDINESTNIFFIIKSFSNLYKCLNKLILKNLNNNTEINNIL